MRPKVSQSKCMDCLKVPVLHVSTHSCVLYLPFRLTTASSCLTQLPWLAIVLSPCSLQINHERVLYNTLAWYHKAKVLNYTTFTADSWSLQKVFGKPYQDQMISYAIFHRGSYKFSCCWYLPNLPTGISQPSGKIITSWCLPPLWPHKHQQKLWKKWWDYLLWCIYTIFNLPLTNSVLPD